MSQPFLGEIRLFPYNFPPRGWAFCQGQTLSIAQNTALFALLGTTYGGDGQTTFKLPDLRGRRAISSGQGTGLANYDLGQVGGTESTTLTVNNLAAHVHTFSPQGSPNAASSTKPLGRAPAQGGSYDATGGQLMLQGTTDLTGGSQPFATLDPYLTLNYCIALQGIFPSRN